MISILDQTSDKAGNGKKWIEGVFAVPQYAAIPFEKTAELSNAGYAWPEAKLFPIDSKENTWWSAAYLAYAKQQKTLPAVIEKVASNIKKAMTLWEIDPSDFVEKTAETKTPVTTVIMKYNDTILHEIPVYDSTGFEKLASWLAVNKVNYPYSVRRDTARQLLACPETLTKDMAEDTRIALEKTAGYAVSTRGNMIKIMDILTKGLEKVGLQELIPNIEKVSELPELISGQSFSKVAELFDATHRILKARSCPNMVNMDVVENLLAEHTMTSLNKEAAKFVELPDGTFITNTQLEKTADSIISILTDVLNKEAVNKDNLKDTLDKLTDDEAVIFSEAVRKMKLYE